MKLFSFLEFKKEHPSLIIDIGNATVGGALVKFIKNQKPQILYSYRESIVHKIKDDNSKLKADTLKTLENVLKIILRDGVVGLINKKKVLKISSLHYVLSSPWILSKIQNLHKKDEKPFKVTESLVKDMVQKEEAGFRNLYDKDSTKDKFDFDIQLVEKSLFEIKLNGYSTHKPFGKMATTLDVPLFLSVTSEKFLEEINTVVEKVFHIHTPVVHSSTLLSYSVLRDVLEKDKDFMLVDISGEMTDISVVKQGILVESTSFGIGTNTIVRKVSKELATVPEIAESQIKIYIDGMSEESISQSIKNVLDKVKKEWQDEFSKSLKNLDSKHLLPQAMYLAVYGGMHSFFKNFIEQEEIENLSISPKDLKVIPITPDFFNQHCNSFKKQNSDIFLTIATIAVHKINENKKDF